MAQLIEDPGHPQPPRPTRWHFAVLGLAWTVFAVYGSLVPLEYHPTSLADAIERFNNLPPLSFALGTQADWAANVLLFIPLTFFWMGALVSDRGPTVRPAFAAATLVVALAAATSTAVEFAQIWFSERTVSRNDIIAETIGGIVGVLVWRVIGARVVFWMRGYIIQAGATSRMSRLLQVYLLGLIIFSMLPLDLTMSLTELYHKYKAGRILLLPFSYPYSSLAALVSHCVLGLALFVPVGVWLVVAQNDREWIATPLFVGLVGGGLIAAAIELAQFMVLSRYTDVTDILLGTLGATIGAGLSTPILTLSKELLPPNP